MKKDMLNPNKVDDGVVTAILTTNSVQEVMFVFIYNGSQGN